MGRPRIGQARKVIVPDDVLDELQLISAHRGVPVAEVIREALRAHTRRVLKQRGRAA